jgi:hypothetical protein
VHHVRVPDAVRDEAQGVPIVSPGLAMHQSIEWGVASDMIEQAIRRGRAHELIGQHCAFQLLPALGHRTNPTGKRSAS